MGCGIESPASNVKVPETVPNGWELVELGDESHAARTIAPNNTERRMLRICFMINLEPRSSAAHLTYPPNSVEGSTVTIPDQEGMKVFPAGVTVAQSRLLPRC
jgi:hypothetical protein